MGLLDRPRNSGRRWLNQSGRREMTLEELGLNVIAGVFVSIFEGKLRDS